MSDTNNAEYGGGAGQGCMNAEYGAWQCPGCKTYYSAMPAYSCGRCLLVIPLRDKEMSSGGGGMWPK